MRSWTNYKAVFAAALLLMLPLVACHAQNKETALTPLVIHTDKTALMFQVEIARTPDELARGLMYRKELAPNKGMLFLFADEHPVAFWMENTLIPLDMIFIRADGTIASIHEMAKPLDRTAIPSGAPVKAVLEIFGGESAKQGIKAGHKIDPALLKTE